MIPVGGGLLFERFFSLFWSVCRCFMIWFWEHGAAAATFSRLGSGGLGIKLGSKVRDKNFPRAGVEDVVAAALGDLPEWIGMFFVFFCLLGWDGCGTSAEVIRRSRWSNGRCWSFGKIS